MTLLRFPRRSGYAQGQRCDIQSLRECVQETQNAAQDVPAIVRDASSRSPSCIPGSQPTRIRVASSYDLAVVAE